MTTLIYDTHHMTLAILGKIRIIDFPENSYGEKIMKQEQIKQIAHLARLHISDAELANFTAEVSQIIGFAEQVQQANTESVTVMADPHDRTQRLRDDNVTEHPDRQQFQQIAPATEAGLYLVPKVIE